MKLTTARPAGSSAQAESLLVLPLVWLALAAFLSLLLALGVLPNGDADDLMKLHEIRHLLATGNPFDRALPGIAQPEPMISHWPWLVDAPYAAVAMVLSPVLGTETAISVAAFAVPLALLFCALAVLRQILSALGFVYPGAVLALAASVGMTAFAEFQPWRIDYHNLQMLLILCSCLLTIRTGITAAALNGAVTALSISISLEALPFLLIPMAYYAWRFVAGIGGAKEELRAFGVTLGGCAGVLYVLVAGPNLTAFAACDRYALPQLAALAGASLVFVAAPLLVDRGGALIRLGFLAAGAVATLLALGAMFPQCLGGPYGALSDYLKENWLLQIEQERSIFESPDFILSGRLARVALALAGAGAALVLLAANRGRNRAWLIFGLYSAIAIVVSLAYLRYVRFLPLFAGPGLAVLLFHVLPPSIGLRRFLALSPQMNLRPAFLAAPGIAMIAALLLSQSFSRLEPADLRGVDLASACQQEAMEPRIWPRGARLLASPLIGVSVLAPDTGPEVVAVPFHTAALGMERAYRFFDPATPDPRLILQETGATHVAVCRIADGIPPAFAARFPLASQLILGQPPAWLEACPDDGVWALRVYRVVGGANIGCPLPAK